MSRHMPGMVFTEAESYYETTSLLTKIKSKVIRLPALNPLGIFQVLGAKGQNCDAYGSFNRFLDADKPYFIYLENPLALYHYTIGRISHGAGRKRFQACLNDPNLKYIVCMSEACRSSFETINMPVPDRVKLKTIYPFVPRNPNITPELVEEKSKGEYLECLYCVQGSRFVSKGGLEVLSAYERLRKQNVKIHLTVITRLSDLDPEAKKRLEDCPDVSSHDFTYSYEELEQVYARTNVLLQPTSDDSSALTVLEAMKGGCAVIGSKLYALPEMVEHGVNGFLVEPKYWFFDENNVPNPAVWNHRKHTIHSTKESERLVREMEDLLLKLSRDRELLKSMSMRSLEIAGEKFGEERICAQWDEVWEVLKGERHHDT
jgi:hypothetical protein